MAVSEILVQDANGVERTVAVPEVRHVVIDSGGGDATAARQDTGNASLASILAKIIPAPSTEAKQDSAITVLNAIGALLTTQAGYLDGIEALIGTTNGKDFATQTTLAAVLASVAAATPAGSNIIGKVEHTTTGLGHGVKVVAAAGTDEALAASTAAKWVTVQAQTDNTGIIAVGATGVDATVATGTGVALASGESITLAIDNLADVFIDATVTGDGVRYTYGT